VASKTVTVKGGKSKTVTLQLNKATRSQLKHRSLKLSVGAHGDRRRGQQEGHEQEGHAAQVLT
jgi:hypothetical protein